MLESVEFVITWTYNFGTFNEICICRLLLSASSGEEKMIGDNFEGKGNAIWTLCNAQLARIFPKKKKTSGMFVQVRQFPCKICQSCTYLFINSDMTRASDDVLAICSSLTCDRGESHSSAVKKWVSNSVAEFISQSGLRLLI